MPNDYSIIPLDFPERWLVRKADGTTYMVELNAFGSGKHCCGCEWYARHSWPLPKSLAVCRHVRMVIDHIITLSKKTT